MKRPPRKDYGKLSADSDDGISCLSNKSKIDNSLDLDNFEILNNGKNVSVSEIDSTDIHGNIMQPHQSILCAELKGGTDCCGNTRRDEHSTRELNANTINTLHAMDLSDDEDYGM